jgi:glycosyltransferase involved in cell wall biosynthesis
MLRNYFGSCDLYCSASKWEGFNIPLVAAQANRKPVIAFNVGAHPEVVINGKTGYLVKTHDEFKESMEKLLENKSVREEMGEKALRFSEKFNWKNSVQKLERIFNKLN